MEHLPKKTNYEENTISPETFKEKAAYKNLRYALGRHDDAKYQLNEFIPQSDDPLRTFDKKEQPLSDLTEKGKEHAVQSANEFFHHFNPEKDEIVIFSSALTRSRETANIYLNIAREKGFSIKVLVGNDTKLGLVDFDNTEEVKIEYEVNKKRGNLSEDLFNMQGGERVRTLNQVSLDNIKQMFIEFLFHPENYLEKVNSEDVDKIPNEYQIIWSEARRIIENDNMGSWGENFLRYSDD